MTDNVNLEVAFLRDGFKILDAQDHLDCRELKHNVLFGLINTSFYDEDGDSRTAWILIIFRLRLSLIMPKPKAYLDSTCKDG